MCLVLLKHQWPRISGAPDTALPAIEQTSFCQFLFLTPPWPGSSHVSGHTVPQILDNSEATLEWHIFGNEHRVAPYPMMKNQFSLHSRNKQQNGPMKSMIFGQTPKSYQYMFFYIILSPFYLPAFSNMACGRIVQVPTG